MSKFFWMFVWIIAGPDAINSAEAASTCTVHNSTTLDVLRTVAGRF